MCKIFPLVILFLFNCLTSAYPMDWKELHSKADKITLEAARKGNSIQDRYVLGLVYLKLHKDYQAFSLFNKILGEDPKSLEAKWGKAEVLRRRHKIKEAKELLLQVFKADHDFPPALLSLALIKFFESDFSNSARASLKVIKRGRRGVDLGNYVRALSLYSGAKGMLSHYGGVFSKMANGPAVKSNLKKAEKLQPDSPAVLFGLGNFYFLAPAFAGGDKEKAEKYLLRAIKEDPLLADAYVRLAQLYRNRGEKDKYESYLKKALAIDSKNELVLDTLKGDCKFICEP